MYVPLTDAAIATTQIVSPVVNADVSIIQDVIGFELLLPEQIEAAIVSMPTYSSNSNFERISVESIRESRLANPVCLDSTTGTLLVRFEGRCFGETNAIHMLRPGVALVTNPDGMCELIIERTAVELHSSRDE